jgi:phage terminase large subunit GpA-like protein
MKMILSSPSPYDISQLKDMLETAGITCFVRNETTVGLSGEIPLNESTPELWITDDSQLEEAARIKRIWQAPCDAGHPWRCPKCGETSDPQFTACWKCGTPRTELA